MAYIDILKSDLSEAIKSEVYDYCIIGSGPAGLTIVADLCKKEGVKILLIESGNHREDEKTQSLYNGHSFHLKNSNMPMGMNDQNYLSSSRLRYLGGSSNHWDGWTRPLDRMDLDHSHRELKWPIKYEELFSYYEKARKTLEVEIKLKDESLGEHVRKIPYHISTPVKFGKKYNELMEGHKDLVVLLNANLCGVHFDGHKNVKSVVVKNLLNKTFELKSKNFILCCGGIENARLLLNFSEKNDEFKSNVLGKKFNDHLFFPMNSSLFVYGKEDLGLNKYIKDNLSDVVMPALALNEKKVKDLKFNNSSLIILNKSEKQNNGPKIKREGVLYDILMVTEATPLMESQITLSKEKDVLGLKKIDMSWKVDNHDLDTPLSYLKELDLELNKEDIGKLKTIFNYNASLKIYWEGYHHMSTTVMGNSPLDSYVDHNLKIHGINNFFVAGSSVFSSPGFANPTLTIVALSHRLADYLLERQG